MSEEYKAKDKKEEGYEVGPKGRVKRQGHIKKKAVNNLWITCGQVGKSDVLGA